MSALDAMYMAKAIILAKSVRHLTRANPRVGCLLVRDGDVIGAGATQPPGSAHAEVMALQSCADPRGATAYVTLEPCAHTGRTPPCADALIKAGLSRVVVACVDPNPKVNGAGLERLRAAGIRVDIGVLESEAEALNPGFNRRVQGGHPFVRMKLAMSLDGATAMANGESKWITGPMARRHVQRMRARTGAVVTGVGTVLADDPSLTVRWDETDLDPGPLKPSDQPLRVVMDRDGRTPASAKLFSQAGPVLMMSERASGPTQEAWASRGAEVAMVAELTPLAVLDALAKAEVNDVMIEAGPTLAGAWMSAGLVDRLVVFQAPLLMGSQTRPLMHTPSWTHLSDALRLELIESRAIGPDRCLEYRVENA